MKNLELTKKQKFWLNHIEAQHQSSMSKKIYCEQNNINAHQLCYYQRLLKQKQDKPAASSSFVALKSIPALQPINLVLPTGIKIEIPSSQIGFIKEILSHI